MKTQAATTLSAIVAALLILSGAAFAQDKDRVDKISNKAFGATVRAVENVLQKNGFMIVSNIDHQNMLVMTGAKLKGLTTIEFGKPEMGKKLFSMAPEAGLEMPGRFFIWERGDGKTIVSYRKPSSGFSTYGSEMLTKMGQDMDGMWTMFADEATK